MLSGVSSAAGKKKRDEKRGTRRVHAGSHRWYQATSRERVPDGSSVMAATYLINAAVELRSAVGRCIVEG